MNKDVRRILQEDDETRDVSDYVGLVAAIIGMILLVTLCVRTFKQKGRRPSPEEELAQRNRQRHLMRQARLRDLGVRNHYLPAEYRTDEAGEECSRHGFPEAEQKRNELNNIFREQKLSMVVEPKDFVVAVGLAPDQLNVEKGHRCIRRPGSSGIQGKHTASQCVICLDSYQDGDNVVWSSNADQCTHCLHLECALDYLVFLDDAQYPCPVCRQPFLATASVQEKDVND